MRRGKLSSEVTLRLSSCFCPFWDLQVLGFIYSIAAEVCTGLVPFAFHTCTGKEAFPAKIQGCSWCLEYFASKLCHPPWPCVAQGPELTLAAGSCTDPGMIIFYSGAGSAWLLSCCSLRIEVNGPVMCICQGFIIITWKFVFDLFPFNFTQI